MMIDMKVSRAPIAFCSLRLCTSLTVLLLAICCSARSQTRQIVRPEDQEITLAGTIRLVHEYGPPGYGEDPKHDAHISYWALEVPVRVNLPCTGEFVGDCKSAKRINLFFEGDGIKEISDRRPAKWKNQKVLITGKLHRADTVGEITPIYMDAQDISAPKQISK